MTVTSLCVLSCKFSGSFAVHSSKRSPPPSPTLQQKRERNQFHVSLQQVFFFFSSSRVLLHFVLLCVFRANRRVDVWNKAQRLKLSFKEENCCFECWVWRVRGQMHWESSGCYSESFQDPLLALPPAPSSSFSSSSCRFHIRPCGSWSNPLLCQSSCSPLRPGSIVEQLVFIAVGERQGSVSSPLPLQMCLDQGEVDCALCVL